MFRGVVLQFVEYCAKKSRAYKIYRQALSSFKLLSGHNFNTMGFRVVHKHGLFKWQNLAIVKAYMLNCKINGTVHIFFREKSYLSPR